MSLHFEYICLDKKNKMGTTLSGTQIKNTYVGILKTTDNAAAGGTLKVITDGSGNDTALSISTTQVKVTNLLIDSPSNLSADEVLVRDSSTGLIGKRPFPNFKSVTVSIGSGTTSAGGGSAVPVTITDSASNATAVNFQTAQNASIVASGGELTFKYDTRGTKNITTGVTLDPVTDIGKTLFVDATSLSGGTIVLPTAAAGRFFRVFVDKSSTTAININAASADYFYGGITVVSTTDDKTAVQTVTRATASGAVASNNQLTLDADSATTGGAEGSFLDLTCYDASGWFVSGNVITSNANPGSIAIINGQ